MVEIHPSLTDGAGGIVVAEQAHASDCRHIDSGDVNAGKHVLQHLRHQLEFGTLLVEVVQDQLGNF